jgi:hypothetical protein
MDLLIDLIDFMVMRASKTGFESQEQLDKYIRCCTRILKMHPNAAAALRPKEEAPAPAPSPAPEAEVGAIDWGVV